MSEEKKALTPAEFLEELKGFLSQSLELNIRIHNSLQEEQQSLINLHHATRQDAEKFVKSVESGIRVNVSQATKEIVKISTIGIVEQIQKEKKDFRELHEKLYKVNSELGGELNRLKSFKGLSRTSFFISLFSLLFACVVGFGGYYYYQEAIKTKQQMLEEHRAELKESNVMEVGTLELMKLLEDSKLLQEVTEQANKSTKSNIKKYRKKYHERAEREYKEKSNPKIINH